MHNPLAYIMQGDFFMEKEKQPYSLCCENNTLTIKGVNKVLEITDKEAQLKLASNTLTVKGAGINITRLDKDQGVVALEYSSLASISFRQGGVSFKGLFR